MTRLRNYFLTGFIVTAPLAITAYLAWSMIGWVDSWVKPYIPFRYNPDNYLPFALPGFGLIVALVVITLIGFLTANFIGRTIVNTGENILGRMPLVRSVYRGLKQILETVLSERSDTFKKVGLIEYPRKGLWALVFVATETRGEVQAKVDDDAGQTIAVFLPTTPNPTSGYLLFVPKQDVIELKMTVEEGAKLVISAGLVAPEYQQQTAALAAEAMNEDSQPARKSRTASSRPNK
ncbi:DUF502 domain-containing protein [Nitratireductor aquimarinus]|nr:MULTISPECIES: DUF502 domain-containing protein [Nitratireductor]MBY6021112.1 DUF502 domain-containing protein [Nitratireductor sp. DP7N14-4]MBN7756326.1 DUF502 domain-containing protein [Nitratireductor aquimarinus]MBN7759910.1 DUF502 domain-containing protein [Nitratireductor aquibiodomus]MBN7776725.1 DUF502 domain-containing protein [Nitratireductor pacificus]MBN7780059.1 DUF502 domain-containing protein [Nitratireductor pacificus]